MPTNYTCRQSLSPTVKDTLLETEISFSPYDAGELRTILQSRAAQASVEGVCDYSAIAKTAAIAAQDVGNARQAIDLLRVGAETAERRGDDRLTGSILMRLTLSPSEGGCTTKSVTRPITHSPFSKQLPHSNRVGQSLPVLRRFCATMSGFGTVSRRFRP